MTLVASALAGGGLSGAASASGSLVESGIPKTSKSPSRPRTSIDVTGDTVRATIRLQRAGRYRATAQTSFDDSACDAHSYGEIHEFFTTHRCRALYRGFVDIQDKNFVILISIATVYMPDPASTTELHRLLVDPDNGGITSLSQERGRYRHVAFTHAPTWWSRGETSLTIVQAQPVGRTPGGVVLDKLLLYYLDNLS
ncbi:MAG: hypothetical protein ACRDS0_14510 [Pseudonocardiaceae bacterium]